MGGWESALKSTQAPTINVGALSDLVEVGGVLGPWELPLACSPARGQVIQVPAIEEVCRGGREVERQGELQFALVLHFLAPDS